MKQERQTFWMCMVDGASYPKVKHWSREEAAAECERLARETNTDVFLLEAVGFVRTAKPTPPVVWKRTSTDMYSSSATIGGGRPSHIQ